MKASELRIGNYYSNNGVRNIEPNDIDFCNRNEESFNDLNKPIELTEEWLKKFGFKNVPQPFTGQLGYSKRSDNYYIGFVKGEIGYSFHNPHINYIINYVHQLQNLYFALTGTELEIK